MKLRKIFLSESRFVAFLVFLIIMIAAGVTASADSGLDRSLALQRKGCISDIVYNLSLHVDSLESKLPEGKIEMEFSYSPDGSPLTIDFAGEALNYLVVNGKKLENPCWQDGHIIVPADLLKEGSNRVEAGFVSADRALNRNPGYMYTLFVPFRAHSVFPCFDQPDMKGRYNLSLSIPRGWKAVSNSPVKSDSSAEDSSYRTVMFNPTEPLSTYLFAFAAGEFQYRTHTDGQRTIGAYFRETDADRLLQLDSVFSLVERSLDILEDFTDIPYPFAKYDLVILPGFQFGGMEHTGATFYNDNALFLTPNATASDILRQATIIAHETAHMWFGDYVTMEWFDEVWTKEVFANYFAAMLARQLLPEYDHDLEWLRVYMAASLDQDRSAGTTPILQQLDNMRDAGLIYNNIIYNKSPLMLAKLVEQGGEEAFREGVRRYLASHPYGNAGWDDFVEAMESAGVTSAGKFSKVWVETSGMPEISVSFADGLLSVKQYDPQGRGIIWPQSFDVAVGDKTKFKIVNVEFDGSRDTVVIPLDSMAENSLVIPVADGRAYGLVSLSENMLLDIMKDFTDKAGLIRQLSPTGRLATLLMLNENYLAGGIPASSWMDFLINVVENTDDSQILASVARYIGSSLLDMEEEVAAVFEHRLFKLAESHTSIQGRVLLLRSLVPYARSADSTAALYDIWDKGSTDILSSDDLCDIALHLSVMLPDMAPEILSRQRKRIDSPDRLRKWDYISQGATNDSLRLDIVFKSLSDSENRLVEPWTLSLLSLLNHPARCQQSIKYIIPALALLPEIQLTGDIFFPANWAMTLLRYHRSTRAAESVCSFLENNPDLNPLLRSKIMHAASRLFSLNESTCAHDSDGVIQAGRRMKYMK